MTFSFFFKIPVICKEYEQMPERMEVTGFLMGARCVMSGFRSTFLQGGTTSNSVSTQY